MQAEEITWSIGETTVDATVTRPDEPGTYPGVVFVAGSGPTDRNWESPLLPGTNGSARLLAEELSSRGYVTLRYDKRVSGARAMENMRHLAGHISFESHFEELLGAVANLSGRPDVDPARLFALTSSEGCAHALYYQTHAGVVPLAGLVLTGAPGRAMSEIANWQIISQARTQPNSDDLIARYKALIEKFERGEPFVPDPVLPEGANNLVAALSAPVNQPFTREFWAFRAADYLKKVAAPVLVVIGKKDLQTDWQLEGARLEEAARGKKDVTFYYPENANHVLKYEPTPREKLTMGDALANYNGRESVIDPDTVKTIVGWLDKHSGIAQAPK